MSAPETAPPSAPEDQVDRFDRVPRLVHRATGILMTVCLLTAAVLYNGSVAVLVGHRFLVEQLHVYAGFALPVPVVLGLLDRAYRDDARRLNRFTPRDWAWLRSRTRRDGTLEVGKFNAGQKLNAALSAGSIGTLLITGAAMRATDLAPLAWRTGATFVHDWFALAVGLLVLGHVAMATRDPHAMTGMRTGRVPLSWARREHAAWAREVTADRPAAGPRRPPRG